MKTSLRASYREILMDQEKLAEKFENELMELENQFKSEGLTGDSLISIYEMRTMAAKEEAEDDTE